MKKLRYRAVQTFPCGTYLLFSCYLRVFSAENNIPHKSLRHIPGVPGVGLESQTRDPPGRFMKNVPIVFLEVPCVDYPSADVGVAGLNDNDLYLQVKGPCHRLICDRSLRGV